MFLKSKEPCVIAHIAAIQDCSAYFQFLSKEQR
jgi:hypothetical protein